MTLPGAEIAGEPVGAVLEPLQGLDVGVGEICDVDIVPDAGPVRGVVVGAEDLDAVPLPIGGLEYQGDEMGLGLVPLPGLAVGVDAGGVEVAKDGVFEAVGGFEILD